MGTISLDRELRSQKAKLFRSKAKYDAADYSDLLAPFRKNGYVIAPLVDIFCRDELHDLHVVGLRHDVDHDFETALRIGEWEFHQNLRSTYCVLHTSWYYGECDGERYHHYEEFIDLCRQLQDMGHEINIHNNYAAMALREGIDAGRLLANEIAALRSYGIQIFGTSTHGDGLCRELAFYNLELFEGRAWDSKGGKRRINGPAGVVELGSVDMERLQLAYEAYDYPRATYVTDSGGRPRVRFGTRGLKGYRLGEDGLSTPYASLSGILTHPIWWDFERTSVPGSRSTFASIYGAADL